jgi:GTP-binding protein HflX
MVAFRATLEELDSANLLLHVIDISNPRFEDQIKSVERILADLNLHNISLIRVLNKKDLVDEETVNKLSRTLDGTAISAKVESTLIPLIKKMETSIYHMRNNPQVVN